MREPIVGDWVTCKTDLGMSSEPGKIISIDPVRGTFVGSFFTESSGQEDYGDSGEVEYFLGDIDEIIIDKQLIADLEEEMA